MNKDGYYIVWFGCFLYCGLPFYTVAQNLVPNPSFEEIDNCPYTIGFQDGDRPLNWMSWSQSPEYFHGCSTESLVGMPQNGWSFQYPWDGDAYVGMLAYSMGDDFREYVGVELLEPLVIGQTYHTSMRANLAKDGDTWPSRVASNRLGMLFTVDPNEWTTIPGPVFGFRNFAHVSAAEMLTDTVNWTLISGEFIADSAYQYLVIGNFFRDEFTDTLVLDQGPTAGGYYLVDSVAVIPMTTGISSEEIGPLPRIWQDFDLETVQLEWSAGYNANFVIVDVTGRIIQTARLDAGHLTLSISTLKSGVYFSILEIGERRSLLKFVR